MTIPPRGRGLPQEHHMPYLAAIAICGAIGIVLGIAPSITTRIRRQRAQR